MSIEDSCDAFGSEIDGLPCGRYGTISTFSFYPAHHLTTGEGGMTLTGDPVLARRIESMCSWGRDCHCKPGFDDTCRNRLGYVIDGVGPYDHKYTFTYPGFNLKPLELQGVLGNVQIQKSDGYKRIRQRNFSRLYAALEPLEDVVRLPVSEPGASPSWFAFPVTLLRGDRAEITRRIESRGVATRMLFAGNAYRQPFMKGFQSIVPFPLENSDVVMKNTFLIGINHTITPEECEHVATVVKEEVTRC
jgi:CDP-6-deoxy-D-xylo-4-hexulose-3-dehydrase